MASAERLQIAEIHGLGGRDDELAALLADLAAGAQDEDGCLAFRVLRADDPGEFVVLEHWRDEASQRAHYKGATYQRYRSGVGELLARPSDVTVHLVAETLHPIDPNPPEPGLFG